MSSRIEGPERRPWRSVAFVLALFVAIPLAVSALRSYRDLTAARDRQAELEERALRADREIEALERRVERMREDPMTLGWLAREELGFVAPGEIVIVFPEDEIRSPPAAPPSANGGRGKAPPAPSS